MEASCAALCSRSLTANGKRCVGIGSDCTTLCECRGAEHAEGRKNTIGCIAAKLLTRGWVERHSVAHPRSYRRLLNGTAITGRATALTINDDSHTRYKYKSCSPSWGRCPFSNFYVAEVDKSCSRQYLLEQADRQAVLSRERKPPKNEYGSAEG